MAEGDPSYHREPHGRLTNIQLVCQTKLTREILDGKKSPQRDMTNRKPYRTKAQKRIARENAYRAADGAWRTDAGVSFHPVPRGSVSS